MEAIDDDYDVDEEDLYVQIGADGLSETIIELENIQKTYLLGVEGVPALRGVSCKIRRGEWVIIYGKSGGGKTTMLNIIGTIDRPTKGHLTVCGQRIGSRTKDSLMAEIRLKRMGFVFQTFNLLSTMTALENVEMPMILRGSLTKSYRRKRATELLTMVGMGERLNHLPSMLSGGEQQRVTIARAVSNTPDILLLDEPTGDLDSHNTDIVLDLLLRLHRDENITMIMVTHDTHLKNAAQRIIYMRDGKIAKNEAVDPIRRAEFLEELEIRLEEHKRKGMRKVGSRPLAFTSQTEIRWPIDSYDYLSEVAIRAGTALLDRFRVGDGPQADAVQTERLRRRRTTYGQGAILFNDEEDDDGRLPSFPRTQNQRLRKKTIPIQHPKSTTHSHSHPHITQVDLHGDGDGVEGEEEEEGEGEGEYEWIYVEEEEEIETEGEREREGEEETIGRGEVVSE